MRRSLLPLLAPLLLAGTARAQPDDAEPLPQPEDPDDDVSAADFIAPVSIQGGPMLCGEARPTAPSTRLYLAFGVLDARYDVGRSQYERIGGRLLIGGAIASDLFPDLEVGADVALLLVDSFATTVAPTLEERETRIDLGETRVHLAYLAWGESYGEDMDLGVTPYLRFTIPTDTSRFAGGRRPMPIHRLLGSQVRDHDFVLVEVGSSLAWRWTLLHLYESLGFVFGAVVDGDFQFLFGSTTGVGIDTGLGLELVLELNLLVRGTDVDRTGTLVALGVSPAVRYRFDDGWYVSLEGRAGIAGEREVPYGDFTLGLVAGYDFDFEE